MIDDEDIKKYGRRIVKLNIQYYEVYFFRDILKEFIGSCIELYDDGPVGIAKNNIYFATFRTIEDADTFRKCFPLRIKE